MKKDKKEFGVADGKVKWEESQRASLRVTPFTRNNTGLASTRTCLYYCNHKKVYSIKFLNYIVNFYMWRLRDISIQ